MCLSYEPLFPSQVRVLAVRNCRWYLRNPELMLAKLFTYIFMGGFMGGPLHMLAFHSRISSEYHFCQELCQGFCMMYGEEVICAVLCCADWERSALCAPCGVEP